MIQEVEQKPAFGVRRRIVLSWVFVALVAASIAAEANECVVVGQNDAATDAPAVQQAVDECADVALRGTFRFAGMENGDPVRVVTVHRSVNIAGQRDTDGHRPQIIGGEKPFLVDAPGEVVRIRDLRLVRPASRAIHVGAAMDAVVADCVIEDVEPDAFGLAIGIIIGGAFDAPINRVVVKGNTIVAGEPVEVGIIAQPSRAIGSLSIDHNQIRATAHGIDLRFVGGSAQVSHNHITMDNSDRTGGPEQYVDDIRCLGEGACSIVSNTIDSQHPNSSGIRLQGTAGAVVENNRIVLTLPEGSAAGAQSSGVQLIADALFSGANSSRNLVGRNQVSGAARTAFSVVGPLPFAPADNVFVLNRHPGFAASFVDTEIGEGARRTVVVNEKGSISDLGTASVLR